MALNRRMYVCGKDIETNTVTIGPEEKLYSRDLTATDINLIVCDKLETSIRVKAKTRYSQKEDWAVVEQLDENHVHVQFDTPQKAITRGQAVVFYDGNLVVGGGTIE